MAANRPSLHALRAFEAAARLGGFNRAAAELGVSPTAVSHHIRGMEAELGVRLFSRRTRRARLTEAGARLAAACSAAFAGLAGAVDELRRGSDRRPVTVALGPILAARWLAPRLPRFWEDFPGVDLRLLHSPVRIDPDAVEADIILAWGAGDWPGAAARPLLRVASTPVASPALIARLGRPAAPADVLRYPLIHQRDRSGWADWLAAAGLPGAAVGGVVIEDANVVLQSVLEGQGIALGWLPVVDDEIGAGRLVRLFDLCVHGPRAYYLIRAGILPGPRRADPLLAEVADWLLREASLSPGPAGANLSEKS